MGAAHQAGRGGRVQPCRAQRHFTAAQRRLRQAGDRQPAWRRLLRGGAQLLAGLARHRSPAELQQRRLGQYCRPSPQ